jgi:hypothetical protein
VSSISIHKHALSVCSYFHILALIYINHPELSQPKVLIHVLWWNNFIKSIWTIIAVIIYALRATRQAVTHIWEPCRFKSIYTLQGKPDTYDTYTFHVSLHMPHVRFPRVGSPYMATFHSDPTKLDGSYYSQEKRSTDTIHSPLTDRSIGLTPIFPMAVIEAVG